MNKYQSALEFIKKSYPQGSSKWEKNIDVLQKLVDQQKQIEDVANNCVELIDKSFPKKPPRDIRGVYYCPTCKCECYWDTDYGQQKFDYCNECGQALNWD